MNSRRFHLGIREVREGHRELGEIRVDVTLESGPLEDILFEMLLEHHKSHCARGKCVDKTITAKVVAATGHSTRGIG